MKDDMFKKIKSILSGSVQLNKDSNSSAVQNSVDEELVNAFMDQILDATWVEEDLKSMCGPSYSLSNKNESYWLMNVTLKSLFNIKGGIEIIPIEKGEPNTLCLIGHSTYSIPNKYIVYSGWN